MFANVLHVIDTCYIQADVLMPKTRLGFAANETGDGGSVPIKQRKRRYFMMMSEGETRQACVKVAGLDSRTFQPLSETRWCYFPYQEGKKGSERTVWQ